MTVAIVHPRFATALLPFLREPCTITTPGTPVDDLYGGETPGTPTTQATKCQIGVPTGNDQKVAERLGVVVDTMILLPAGTVIDPTCTITITANGHVYAVTMTSEDASDAAGVRCGCRRFIS